MVSEHSQSAKIKRLFAGSAKFHDLIEQIESHTQAGPVSDGEKPRIDPIRLAGLSGGATTFLLASLYEKRDGNILFLTADFDNAQNLADDLANLIGEEAVQFFPTQQVFPYEFRSPTGDITGQRLAALAALVSAQKRVVIAPARAVVEPTMARDIFETESLHLEVGQELDPDDLARRLVSLGFSRVGNVEEVGDFAVRGGLIDFFSPSSELPVRAEFFGDTIDSLRHFDVRDQRTVEKLDAVDLLPRREVPVRSETIEDHLAELHEKDADLIRARFICRAWNGWPFVSVFPVDRFSII